MTKEFFKEKIKYWWTLLYAVFYFACFNIIEKTEFQTIHYITTDIDYRIPFCEWFIFFYYAWFAFLAIGFVYLFFFDKKNYLKMMTALYIGMTLFIIVSVIYPNGLDLRPSYLPNRNIACVLVNAIYRNDTPTNVLPSIHVFNSIGLAVAIDHTDLNKHWKSGCWFLAIMIILSTFFVKQHSVTDAVAAVALYLILYYIVYIKDHYFLKNTLKD